MSPQLESGIMKEVYILRTRSCKLHVAASISNIERISERSLRLEGRRESGARRCRSACLAPGRISKGRSHGEVLAKGPSVAVATEVLHFRQGNGRLSSPSAVPCSAAPLQALRLSFDGSDMLLPLLSPPSLSLSVSASLPASVMRRRSTKVSSGSSCSKISRRVSTSAPRDVRGKTSKLRTSPLHNKKGACVHKAVEAP